MRRSDQNQHGSDNNDGSSSRLNTSLNFVSTTPATEEEDTGSQSPRYTRYRTSLASSVTSSPQSHSHSQSQSQSSDLGGLALTKDNLLSNSEQLEQEQLKEGIVMMETTTEPNHHKYGSRRNVNVPAAALARPRSDSSTTSSDASHVLAQAEAALAGFGWSSGTGSSVSSAAESEDEHPQQTPTPIALAAAPGGGSLPRPGSWRNNGHSSSSSFPTTGTSTAAARYTSTETSEQIMVTSDNKSHRRLDLDLDLNDGDDSESSGASNVVALAQAALAEWNVPGNGQTAAAAAGVEYRQVDRDNSDTSMSPGVMHLGDINDSPSHDGQAAAASSMDSSVLAAEEESNQNSNGQSTGDRVQVISSPPGGDGIEDHSKVYQPVNSMRPGSRHDDDDDDDDEDEAVSKPVNNMRPSMTRGMSLDCDDDDDNDNDEAVSKAVNNMRPSMTRGMSLDCNDDDVDDEAVSKSKHDDDEVSQPLSVEELDEAQSDRNIAQDARASAVPAGSQVASGFKSRVDLSESDTSTSDANRVRSAASATVDGTQTGDQVLVAASVSKPLHDEADDSDSSRLNLDDGSESSGAGNAVALAQAALAEWNVLFDDEEAVECGPVDRDDSFTSSSDVEDVSLSRGQAVAATDSSVLAPGEESSNNNNGRSSLNRVQVGSSPPGGAIEDDSDSSYRYDPAQFLLATGLETVENNEYSERTMRRDDDDDDDNDKRYKPVNNMRPGSRHDDDDDEAYKPVSEMRPGSRHADNDDDDGDEEEFSQPLSEEDLDDVQRDRNIAQDAQASTVLAVSQATFVATGSKSQADNSESDTSIFDANPVRSAASATEDGTQTPSVLKALNYDADDSFDNPSHLMPEFGLADSDDDDSDHTPSPEELDEAQSDRNTAQDVQASAVVAGSLATLAASGSKSRADDSQPDVSTSDANHVRSAAVATEDGTQSPRYLRYRDSLAHQSSVRSMTSSQSSSSQRSAPSQSTGNELLVASSALEVLNDGSDDSTSSDYNPVQLMPASGLASNVDAYSKQTLSEEELDDAQGDRHIAQDVRDKAAPPRSQASAVSSSATEADRSAPALVVKPNSSQSTDSSEVADQADASFARSSGWSLGDADEKQMAAESSQNPVDTDRDISSSGADQTRLQTAAAEESSAAIGTTFDDNSDSSEGSDLVALAEAALAQWDASSSDSDSSSSESYPPASQAMPVSSATVGEWNESDISDSEKGSVNQLSRKNAAVGVAVVNVDTNAGQFQAQDEADNSGESGSGSYDPYQSSSQVADIGVTNVGATANDSANLEYPPDSPRSREGKVATAALAAGTVGLAAATLADDSRQMDSSSATAADRYGSSSTRIAPTAGGATIIDRSLGDDSSFDGDFIDSDDSSIYLTEAMPDSKQGERSEQKQSEEELVESERNSTLVREARVSAAQAGLQATFARQKQAEQKQSEEELVESERNNDSVREARVSAAQAGLQATLLASQRQAQQEATDDDESVSRVSSVDPTSQARAASLANDMARHSQLFQSQREREEVTANATSKPANPTVDSAEPDIEEGIASSKEKDPSEPKTTPVQGKKCNRGSVFLIIAVLLVLGATVAAVGITQGWFESSSTKSSEEDPVNTVSPMVPVTASPTVGPTTTDLASRPTTVPTRGPAIRPISVPTSRPTLRPILRPSLGPTLIPTSGPTNGPTLVPSFRPTTLRPSSGPTNGPTLVPSSRPTTSPTVFVVPQDLMDLISAVSFDGGVSAQLEGTPQNQAAKWLGSSAVLDTLTDEQQIQRYSLAVFYYSTNGDSWSNNDEWLSDANECTWFTRAQQEQICDSNGLYLGLLLGLNGVDGTLPPEIGLLPSLLAISIGGGFGGSIEGTLPSYLGLLTQMQFFNVRDNAFTGIIPPELGAWTALQVLDLSRNRFSGPIPTTVGQMTALTRLDLSRNRLTGMVPNELANLNFLEVVRFENNDLTGTVPTDVCTLFSSTTPSFYTDCGVPPGVGSEIDCFCCTHCCSDVQGCVPVP